MWKLLYYYSKYTCLINLSHIFGCRNQTIMVNPEIAKIQHAGEKLVEAWLISNGYNHVEKESTHSKEPHLRANGIKENILIQVRTFVHPHRPFKFSDFEIDKLTRRAVKLNLIAYAAYVVVDANNDLVGDITWERLS